MLAIGPGTNTSFGWESVEWPGWMLVEPSKKKSRDCTASVYDPHKEESQCDFCHSFSNISNIFDAHDIRFKVVMNLLEVSQNNGDT